MEELENWPAWHESKVKSKQGVIEQAQKECKNSFLCNAHGLMPPHKIKLDKKFQTYKGRVVLCGDVVKDD